MIMCVLSTIMYDIMVVLQCTPIDYIWRRSIGDPAIQGTCHYTAMLVTCGYLYNSLVAACDLTLGILPLFIVRHLQMPLVTKIAVAAILSLAGLAAACAIVRFAYIGSLEGIDFLYDTVDFTIWAQLELAVGITASSLATLGPLLRLYRRLASGAEQEETPVVPERPVYRRRRGVLDLSMPLSILVGSVATQFRPDKLATTVSEVRCGPRDEEASSQIRLTAEDGRGVSAGTNETGTGIYRKYELSQISDVESNGARGKE
ncbi:hypothetical protein BJY04DRAFT_88474 [Aspergillus karnatakaensis]|uniref:uncharacterized protein n=1 Tax=Aspergillus karnatakaensis TaxID=1810916 RepID=UPI003CCD5ADD